MAALAVDAAGGRRCLKCLPRASSATSSGFAQLLADSTADASGSATPSPQDRAVPSMLATMVGGMVLARATAAAQPALSNELMQTLQTQLTDWLEDDTPALRTDKGRQRLFNKHRQPFESHHITGARRPGIRSGAAGVAPGRRPIAHRRTRRHQAAGRASAASPRTRSGTAGGGRSGFDHHRLVTATGSD